MRTLNAYVIFNIFYTIAAIAIRVMVSFIYKIAMNYDEDGELSLLTSALISIIGTVISLVVSLNIGALTAKVFRYWREKALLFDIPLLFYITMLFISLVIIGKLWNMECYLPFYCWLTRILIIPCILLHHIIVITQSEPFDLRSNIDFNKFRDTKD